MTTLADLAWQHGLETTNTGFWGDRSKSLTFAIRYGDMEMTWPMHLLTPISIDSTTRKQLWLLPLVDVRYFWQTTLTSRDLEWKDEDGNTEEEWEDLFEKLGEILDPTMNIEVVHEEINEDYERPDREFFMQESVSAAIAMDMAAISVGLRPVFNGTDEIDLQDADAAESALTERFTQTPNVFGALTPRSPIGKTLTMISRTLDNQFANLDVPYYTDAETDGVPNEEGYDYAYDLTLYKQPLNVWTTYFAEVDFGQTEPVTLEKNKLEDLANQIATDARDWWKYHYAIALPATEDIELCGYDDCIQIMTTRVGKNLHLAAFLRSMPADFLPRLQLSQKRNLYVHPDHGMIFVADQTGEDGEADGVTAEIESGIASITAETFSATPVRKTDEPGEYVSAKNSAGDPVVSVVATMAPDLFESTGQVMQAKQIDNLPMIDVIYCE
jgi:hypothetical protein